MSREDARAVDAGRPSSSSGAVVVAARKRGTSQANLGVGGAPQDPGHPTGPWRRRVGKIMVIFGWAACRSRAGPFDKEVSGPTYGETLRRNEYAIHDHREGEQGLGSRQAAEP
jgi:hypothetical protein